MKLSYPHEHLIERFNERRERIERMSTKLGARAVYQRLLKEKTK